ncbi:MAG: SIS domain-containing protein [Azospirillaceae bacterium]
MTGFDEARYITLMSGAVDQAGEIGKAVSGAVSDGCDTVMFLGTGGAGYLMEPARQLLARQSTIAAVRESPAEIVLTGSTRLGPRTLVVLPSLSGTTDETQAALAAARAAGARTLALTGAADSPVAKGADHVFVNPAADDTSSESFYIQSLSVALSAMQANGDVPDSDDIRAEMPALPAALLDAKRAFAADAAEIARTIAGSDWHIFTGAGPVWFEALYFATCILEEMQWIRTRPVHASDFFHGTLELVETGVSVVVLAGEDSCRPLAQRVADFVPRHGGSLTFVDTATQTLPGLSPRLRELMGPAVLAAMLQCVAEELAGRRDHPLTTRRYYRRVAY